MEAVVRQLADTQREIDFFGWSLRMASCSFTKALRFWQSSKAAGVFVEAVDEFEIARFGTGAADLFDDAEAHAAAAVDGNAGRFVDDQKRIVFVNDVKFARRRGLAFRRPLFSAMRIGGMRTVSPA